MTIFHFQTLSTIFLHSYPHLPIFFVSTAFDFPHIFELSKFNDMISLVCPHFALLLGEDGEYLRVRESFDPRQLGVLRTPVSYDNDGSNPELCLTLVPWWRVESQWL